MGLIDTLSDAGDAAKGYFSTRFKAFGKAYGDAWGKEIWQGFGQMWSGFLTMGMSQREGRDSYLDGLGLFLDGTLGVGGSFLKGTVGGLFEAPGLHEFGWTLDKAYRYSFAYPVSWLYSTPQAAALAARERVKNGESVSSAYLGALIDRQPFGSRGIWSSDVRKTTPGQAVMWGVGGLVGGVAESITPGDADLMSWVQEHDPRTEAGQAKYNSDDAEFLLKYGSGTLDFISVIGVDPSRGAGAALKGARVSRLNIATPEYIAKGGIEKEVTSQHFENTYQAAKIAPTPEAFRARVMPRAPLGGRAAVTLWAAANISKDVFRDAYIVARGLNGMYTDTPNIGSAFRDGQMRGRLSSPDATTGDRQNKFRGQFGAMERLKATSPEIATDLVRNFNAWNVGEDALAFGYDPVSTKAMQQLARTDLDAFLSALDEGRGIWGMHPGSLMDTEQPKTTRMRDASIRFHEWATKPKATKAQLEELSPGIYTRFKETGRVHVGRFVKKFMPSQGHTSFLDAEDGTVTSLRHFKANLERAGLRPDRVEYWASQWAAKTLREGRHIVYQDAVSEAIGVIADRHGLDVEEVKRAMPEVARYQDAAKTLLEQGETYITERAARQAAIRAYRGLKSESPAVKAAAGKSAPSERKGQFGQSVVAMPDIDGELHILLQDVRLMPGLAPDPAKVAMVSQTRKYIPTIDLQSLDGQLKYWRWMHTPKKLAPTHKKFEEKEVKHKDGTTSTKMVPADVATITAGDVLKNVGIRTLAARAVVKHQIDKMVTAADFANMVWKASALLRPAQTPRNLADDVLRRMMVFGNLPMLMSLMRSPMRIMQNYGRRGELLHDAINEALTRRRATRTTVADVSAEIDGEVASRRRLRDKVRATTDLLREGEWDEAARELRAALLRETKRDELPPDLGRAWVDGIIGWDDFGDAIRGWAASPHLWANLGDVYRILGEYDRTLRPQSMLTIQTENVPRGQERQVTKAPLFSNMEASAKKPNPVEEAREFKRMIIRHYFGQNGKPFRFLETREPRFALDAEAERPKYFTDEKPWTEAELKAEKKTGSRPKSPETLAKEEKAQERRASYIADWIQAVSDRHRAQAASMRRSARRGNEDRVYGPGHVLVNPFDGEISKLNPDDFTILKHKHLDAPINKDGRVSLEAISHLEHYILDELDDLMRPDAVLSLAVEPNGHIRMGVALAKKEVAEAQEIKRGSAKFRLKNFKIKDIVDAGHTRINVKLRDGRTIELQAAFEGAQGEDFMHRVSAVGGAGTWQYLVGDFSPNRLLDAEGGWGVVRPTERGYAQSWERAVNAQLAGDAVAVQFLRGKTESDVIHWAERTPEGSEYINRLKFKGTDYVNHIRQVAGIVDIYAPYHDSAAGRHLREAIAQRVATVDDLKKVAEETGEALPDVHGASLKYSLGRGAVFKQISYAVDAAQRYLSDLPTDKASRFPFFSEAYKRHLTDLVKTSDFHAGKTGHAVSVDEMFKFEQLARERALHDTKYYLYDVTQMNDIARLTRLIVPFSSAIMDSYIKYSRIIRDTGGAAVLQGLYYWEFFDRGEMVQDENGYVLRKDANGDAFYKVDPETKEMVRVPDEEVGKQRYVQFRLPSDLGHMVGKKYFGFDTQPVFAVNKKAFNVFIDLPSTGPLVAIPANAFALDNPEFAESDVVKKFVLPFGPSTDVSKIAIPSTVRSAWETFQGEDGPRAEAQAKAIFQAELIAYAREERKSPPSIQEARARAASMQGLRFASAWITPVSFQTISPYQPYIDTYRQMQREDPASADERFFAQYGEDFYAVAMSVTRNNAGMQATLASNKAFERHKNLVAAYPDLAGIITGADAGAMAQMLYKDAKDQGKYSKFSKAVYEAQKQTPIRPGSDTMIREVMSLDESVQELQKRTVWRAFQQMQDIIDADMVDRGITSLGHKRAKDLAAMRDAFIEQNKMWKDPATGMEAPSPWYVDYTTNNNKLMQTRIEAMWKIVQDPDLQKRDDIRGLAQYLSAREEMQQRMAAKKLKSLSSQKAARLKTQWDNIRFGIREGNTMFAPIWTRYLSNDDALQA